MAEIISHDVLAAFTAVWSDARRLEALQRRVDSLERDLARARRHERVCRCTIADCTVCGDALLIECNHRYSGGRESRCDECNAYFCRTHLDEMSACGACGANQMCLDCMPPEGCCCGLLKCNCCATWYPAEAWHARPCGAWHMCRTCFGRSGERCACVQPAGAV